MLFIIPYWAHTTTVHPCARVSRSYRRRRRRRASVLRAVFIRQPTRTQPSADSVSLASPELSFGFAFEIEISYFFFPPPNDQCPSRSNFNTSRAGTRLGFYERSPPPQKKTKKKHVVHHERFARRTSAAVRESCPQYRHDYQEV